MAVLVRITDFIPNTLIQSQQVDDEFNQLVNILSGVSTSKNALIKFSDATIPPLTLDQTGAGLIQSWKQNGVEVASVDNSGTVIGTGLVAISSGPFLNLTDTDGEDFRLSVNADVMSVINQTGPISFMTFRGGANDDIRLLRPTTVESTLNIETATPTLNLVDTNGEDFLLAVDGDLATLQMGGLTHITLRGGANDDLQVNRPAILEGLAVDAAIPLTIRRVDQTGRNFRFSPSVLKNGTNDPHLDLSSGQSYSAGMFLEQTGAILNLGINGIAQLNARDTTKVGGNFRFDTRTSIGINTQAFYILGIPTGGSVENTDLVVNLQDGNIFLNPTRGLVGVNRTSSIGAQLDVLSGATSRVALIADMPSSPTVDIAKFKVNGVDKLQIKNNGQILNVPKNINRASNTVGNVGAGLDDLHTFSLPAGSLNADGDTIRLRYSGLLANNANTKRIVVSFGGVTLQDTGLFACPNSANAAWTYDIEYIRLSSTSVRGTMIGAWNFITRDTGGTLNGSGFLFALNADLTGLSALGSNAQTMKVAAESGASATDDIRQNYSNIDLTQNT